MNITSPMMNQSGQFRGNARPGLGAGPKPMPVGPKPAQPMGGGGGFFSMPRGNSAFGLAGGNGAPQRMGGDAGLQKPGMQPYLGGATQAGGLNTGGAPLMGRMPMPPPLKPLQGPAQAMPGGGALNTQPPSPAPGWNPNFNPIGQQWQQPSPSQMGGGPTGGSYGPPAQMQAPPPSPFAAPTGAGAYSPMGAGAHTANQGGDMPASPFGPGMMEAPQQTKGMEGPTGVGGGVPPLNTPGGPTGGMYGPPAQAPAPMPAPPPYDPSWQGHWGDKEWNKRPTQQMPPAGPGGTPPGQQAGGSSSSPFGANDPRSAPGYHPTPPPMMGKPAAEYDQLRQNRLQQHKDNQVIYDNTGYPWRRGDWEKYSYGNHVYDAQRKKAEQIHGSWFYNQLHKTP